MWFYALIISKIKFLNKKNILEIDATGVIKRRNKI